MAGLIAQQQIPNIRETLVDVKGCMRQRWWSWLDTIWRLQSVGFTGTVNTAKLTPGGVNGSMTFQNGILISQVQAT